jgi:hypothetical protein
VVPIKVLINYKLINTYFEMKTTFLLSVRYVPKSSCASKLATTSFFFLGWEKGVLMFPYTQTNTRKLTWINFILNRLGY